MRDQLVPFRGHHVASGVGAFGYNGPVELWLGAAARFLGRGEPELADAAVADLEQAVRACAVNGAAPYRVEGQVELAAALAARAGRGDAERARTLLADGVRQAEALGMTAVAARARALGRSLAEASGTEALTRREREVAELVAQGMTNRQIAERLFLSERTAQNHVQHNLTKLGLPNRSQIAVWVAQQSEHAD